MRLPVLRMMLLHFVQLPDKTMKKLWFYVFYLWEYKKRRKEKVLVFLEENNLKLVKKRDTSIVLGCFNQAASVKKKGKIDLMDEQGNILDSGLSEAEVPKKMKEYEDAAKKEGISTKEYLKKVAERNRRTKKRNSLKNPRRLKEFREDLDNFLRERRVLREHYRLNKNQLWSDFVEAFDVKHFSNIDNLNFFNRIVNKYPQLARLDDVGRVIPDRNIAEFKTQYLKNNEIFEEITELIHSGKGNKYPDDFISVHDRPEWVKFQVGSTKKVEGKIIFIGVKDVNGQVRKGDSELKYVFHFIRDHLRSADEFIVETKNIFITCTSCQQELLILKRFVESQNKTLKLIVYGDESIKGGREFADNLLNK